MLIRDFETVFVILIWEHSGIKKLLRLYGPEKEESLLNSFMGSSVNLAVKLKQNRAEYEIERWKQISDLGVAPWWSIVIKLINAPVPCLTPTRCSAISAHHPLCLH